MKYTTILLVALVSCSPKKQLQRLIEKNPELVTTQTIYVRDTIVRNDTFVIKQRIDSFVLKTDTFIDTKQFYITKYRDVVKIVSKPDTVLIKDTFFYEKYIQAPYIEVKQKSWVDNMKTFLICFGFVLGVGFVAGAILTFVKRFLN